MKLRLSLVLAFLLLLSVSQTGLAADCAPMPGYFSLRTLTFSVVEGTLSHDVKIDFPKLSELECEANRHALGTDYTFEVKKSDPIVLTSTSSDRNISNVSGRVTAHVTFYEADRRETPHFLEIADEASVETYYVYLSYENGPKYVSRKSDGRMFAVKTWK